MIQGFKDFILRGNVIELAVAVVIGAAFGAIVTAFTSGIIQPLVNSVSPPSSQGLGFTLVPGRETSYVDFSLVVTALVNFLIVAAVVYFVFVLPINTLKERRARGQEPGPAVPTDVELLTEIRDLLRTQAANAPGGTAGTEGTGATAAPTGGTASGVSPGRGGADAGRAGPRPRG